MPESRLVHVVDDDDAVRGSAAFLLESAGYEVATYASGVAFLGALGKARPGCILLDIHMPQLSGLEVQGRLENAGVPWPVIVLTGQGDVGIAVQAMKNGAFEFLEKPYQNTALLAVIADAFDKLEKVSEVNARNAEAKALVGALTGREMQVMQGLLAALPNKLIAHELGLSVRTVEIYRATIMRKLRARGLSAAVRIALAAGVEPMSEGRG